MIPCSRPKLSDLYTLSQSKLLEIDTLQSGTYLYSPYMAILPPSPPWDIIVTVPLPMADLVGLITSFSEAERAALEIKPTYPARVKFILCNNAFPHFQC